MRRLRSAHFCERTKLASMVLPRPTSSANNAAFRQRGAKGEQRGFDLVGVQIDLGIDKRTGELFDAIGRASLGELMCKVLRMVRRQVNRVATWRSTRVSFVRHQDSPTSAAERRTTAQNSGQPARTIR